MRGLVLLDDAPPLRFQGPAIIFDGVGQLDQLGFRLLPAPGLSRRSQRPGCAGQRAVETRFHNASLARSGGRPSSSARSHAGVSAGSAISAWATIWYRSASHPENGSGRITERGVNVIEEVTRVGSSQTDYIRKLIAVIDHSKASEQEKKQAKVLLENLASNGLVMAALETLLRGGSAR